MNIEIWSDFACPFCYIGKRHLEKALDQFPHKNHVTVEFKSFELDPHAEKFTEKTMAELLAGKYRIPVTQAENMTANVASQANSVGLTYHFDSMQPTNMLDAHRLTQFAKTKGKANELAERLFYAYFTESKHLSTPETLVELATEAGLDSMEAADVLASKRYTEEVKQEHQHGVSLGLQGVPFFVIDRTYIISGAQPPSVFLESLQKAWEEQHPSTSDQPSDDMNCSDGTCKS
ncbi:DsbA family oxidoreductase [Alkalicoccobacillus porphyridii]|uniref:DsbA family oxidoreductase n=1 Tax=Alkalicoccobacillus porphyridii TaxID=2597270 RepID=A0A554A0L4_9BACI|nr:DsbA family oxidoreductase [Alkalicoccobacillus porphyridii]TSB47228.1 DsbA family oxidoreductase [Alkalicoccobacillus porphyridii]